MDILHTETTLLESGENIQEVALEAIEVNPNQPRRHFSKEELAELAQSIQEHVRSHMPQWRVEVPRRRIEEAINQLNQVGKSLNLSWMGRPRD